VCCSLDLQVSWSVCFHIAHSVLHVGLTRTINTRMHGIFGREITKYTTIYGVYIRSWPTLVVCHVVYEILFINSYSCQPRQIKHVDIVIPVIIPAAVQNAEVGCVLPA